MAELSKDDIVRCRKHGFISGLGIDGLVTALLDTIAARDKRIAYLENEVKQFNEVLAEANELSKEKTWPQA